MIEERILKITTIADGSATVTDTKHISGRLVKVQWVDGDLVDGVDAVLSAIRTASGVDEVLITLTNANADAIYRPRALVHTEAGAALTGTQGGDREAPLFAGVLQVVVAAGGATKSGAIICSVES